MGGQSAGATFVKTAADDKSSARVQENVSKIGSLNLHMIGSSSFAGSSSSIKLMYSAAEADCIDLVGKPSIGQMEAHAESRVFPENSRAIALVKRTKQQHLRSEKLFEQNCN